MTLHSLIKRRDISPKVVLMKTRRKCVLGYGPEKQLVVYLLNMEETLF